MPIYSYQPAPEDHKRSNESNVEGVDESHGLGGYALWVINAFCRRVSAYIGP